MSNPLDTEGRRHGVVAGKMLLLAAGMFGFGYLMVPIYDVICDITGLNGKTGRVSAAEVADYAPEGNVSSRAAQSTGGIALASRGNPARGDAVPATADDADVREVTVEFVASINSGGAWVFEPNERTMQVRPGELYHATYHAENLRNEPVVGQATPSVTPFAAAKYFNKTECFCFTRQNFGPRGRPEGTKEMPLTFVIDPDLPINVDRVTLSYTFFDSPDQS